MSVEIQIEVSGSEEFAQSTERFDRGMQKQVQQRLGEWADTVKAEAAKRVPVRTGYLQSTIYTKTHQWQTEVGAEAAYAYAVEFGTRCAQAKPFIQPALEQNLPHLESALLVALDSAKLEAGV